MWKLLLAALAALIAIVIIIGGKFDISQFQNIQIPFPQFSPTKAVDILLWPANFTFETQNPINLFIDNTSFVNFTGTIYSDFVKSKITFRPTGSQLEITTKMADINMGSANLSKLTFESTKIETANLTAIGDIEINSFSGTLAIQNMTLKLTGNVSQLVIKIGSTIWQIK
jgi:hypothetical protein